MAIDSMETAIKAAQEAGEKRNTTIFKYAYFNYIQQVYQHEKQ